MSHENFHFVEALGPWDLGFELGKLFKEQAQQRLEQARADGNWGAKVQIGNCYRSVAYDNDEFSPLAAEIDRYAQGAQVNSEELWALSLESELDEAAEHCTTVVTNDGSLILHNEDGSPDEADSVCVLKKGIGQLTVLEIYYYNTLGGNAVSINSRGFAQMINTLPQKYQRVGVPRNVIARWLSESGNPERDFTRLTTLNRASGYSHTIVHRSGWAWNLESTSVATKVKRVDPPYIHTNHFLCESLERTFGFQLAGSTSKERYKKAFDMRRQRMTVKELMELSETVASERTLAKVILDLKEGIAKIWLKREAEKGWIDYELP